MSAGSKGWGSKESATSTSTWGTNQPAQQQQQQVGKVDTQTSKNLIRLAQEGRNIGAETLTELEVQAEAIDRIEYNVDNINHNLDKAERSLRGIESVSGALHNAFNKDKSKGPGAFEKVDRKVCCMLAPWEGAAVPLLLLLTLYVFASDRSEERLSHSQVRDPLQTLG
jgi:hypothetical protein